VPRKPKADDSPTFSKAQIFLIMWRDVAQWGRYALIGLTIVGTVYYGVYMPVVASAGQTTTISFIADLAAKVEADRWVAYAIGISGAGYGLVERNLRKRTIARLSQPLRRATGSCGDRFLWINSGKTFSLFVTGCSLKPRMFLEPSKIQHT
jgi:hypothetical protein